MSARCRKRTCHVTEKHMSRYVARLWLNGSSATALLNSYVDVAYTLGLPAKAGEVHKAVHRWMAMHSPCLVVIDNVYGTADDDRKLDGLVPHVGHVLFTSRCREWDLLRFSVVEVAPFSKMEALELLGVNRNQAAHELVQWLDCVPLAIGVARAAIEAERRDVPDFGPAQFLELVKQHELASAQPQSSKGSTAAATTSYRHANLAKTAVERMDAVYASSLKRLPEMSQDLLWWLAHLQPDCVAINLLSHWNTSATGVSDALEPLVAVHLVRRVHGGQAISMHGTLQRAVRRRWPVESLHALSSVVRCVGKHFQYDEYADHAPTRQWAPHVAIIVEHAQANSINAVADTETLGLALHSLGQWLLFLGQYDAACRALRRASDMVTQGSHGAQILNDIGRVHVWRCITGHHQLTNDVASCRWIGIGDN